MQRHCRAYFLPRQCSKHTDDPWTRAREIPEEIRPSKRLDELDMSTTILSPGHVMEEEAKEDEQQGSLTTSCSVTKFFSLVAGLGNCSKRG